MRNPINNAKMARYLYRAAGSTFQPWFGTQFLTVGPGPVTATRRANVAASSPRA